MTFIYFAVIELVGKPFGGLFSSTIFVINSALMILVVPVTAKRIDRMELSHRLRRSLWLQLALLGLAILPGFFPPLSIALYPLFLACIGALTVAGILNMQLCLAFPLELDRRGDLPIMRSGALSNLAARGMFAMSPLIANALPSGQWLTAATFNAATYLGGFAASLIALYLLQTTFIKSSSAIPTPHENTDALSVPTAIQGALARWSYAFFFLVNLALGSVAFLLIALGKDTTSVTLLPPLTALYGGMTAALLVALLIPRQWLLEDKMTLRTTTLLLYIQCIVLIVVGGRIVNDISVLCALFGFLYGLTLLSLSEVITKRLQSSTFVKYMANGQVAGRVGSVAATVASGALLDAHCSPWRLLTILGLCGTGFAAFLHYYGRKNTIMNWTPTRMAPIKRENACGA